MAHGLRSHKPSAKSKMIGSQPLKPASLSNSIQSARTQSTKADSIGLSTQGNQGFTFHQNAINLSNDQGYTSQPETTHLYNETSRFSSIVDTGDDTEPEDNNESSNSIGDIMNQSGTLKRSRLDAAARDRLVASILEVAAAQGCDAESVVGASPNHASGPTISARAPTRPTISSSPVFAAGPFNTSMAHEMASHLAADSASIRKTSAPTNGTSTHAFPVLTVSAFGPNASSAFHTDVSFPDYNTWNGSSGSHNFSASVSNQPPNAFNERSNDVSSSRERSGSSERSSWSSPSFSNNSNNVHSSSYELNVNARWNNHERTRVSHSSNFDFSENGHIDIDTWPSPSSGNLIDSNSSSSLSTYRASNDVEMDLYNPLGGCHGVEGFQISTSSIYHPNYTTDAWNGAVIPPLSLEPNAPDAKVVAATSREQIAYEAIDLENPGLCPLRQRLAPPPVELSSIDLDPQLAWVQDSSALSSPESPAAAAVVYDNFPTVMPSSYDHSDEVVQYIPFPWPTSGLLGSKTDEVDEIGDEGEQMDDQVDEAVNQPRWIQTDENDETENHFEQEQMDGGCGFYPPPEPACPLSGVAIHQDDSPFQRIYHQSGDTSCFRPLKELATAMGRAVHHYIGHRVQRECPYFLAL